MGAGTQHMAAPARRFHRTGSSRGGRAGAAELAARLRHLPWPDRMAELDREVWRRAQRALDAGEITRLVNREPPVRPARVRRFARRTVALLGEVAARLEAEDGLPARPLRTLLAALDPARRGAEPDLLGRPGLAFLVLACVRADSAAAFAARGAFFRALREEDGAPQP